MPSSYTTRQPQRRLVVMLSLVLMYATAVLAASTDTTCVDACSDWSVTLGHCRGIYGNLPEQQNATFADEFVDCLCVGWNNDAELGTDAMAASVGTCQACEGTPARVQEDLSTLLELCTIESQNGSASGAMTYTPVGYSLTSVDNATTSTSDADLSAGPLRSGFIVFSSLALGLSIAALSSLF